MNEQAKQEMKKTIADEIKKLLTEELKGVKKCINEAKKEIKEDIAQLRQEIEEIKKDVEQQKTDIDEIKKENSMLKKTINFMDQYSRKQDIIISGIEEKKDESDEDLLEAIQDVAKSLGVPLEVHEVNTYHRLAPNKNKKRAVIVRLNNRLKKSKLVKASRLVKLQGIYVNNHLTKYTISLLAEARELRDQGKIKHAWESECQILVRAKEDSPAIKISSYEDLKKVAENSSGMSTRKVNRAISFKKTS